MQGAGRKEDHLGEGQRPESPPWLGQDHFCLHGVYRDSEGSFVLFPSSRAERARDRPSGLL